jgi:UDP-N-acetylmuramate-alanine ligase
VGEVDGVTIIDDYGHHPVEIRAVLAAAREGVQNRVIAVVQPHRFTRLRDHIDDFAAAFNDADIVYAAPVYPAGEQPIEGVDSAAMVWASRSRASQRASDRGRWLCGDAGRTGSARRYGGLPWRGRYHQMGGGLGRRHSRAKAL